MDLIKSRNEEFGLPSLNKKYYFTFGKFDYIYLDYKCEIEHLEEIGSLYQNIDEDEGDILKKTFVLYSDNENDDFFCIDGEYLFFVFLDLTESLKFENIKDSILRMGDNIRVYKTIDSFNALVCIKTKSYQEGEEFILKINSLKINGNKIVTYSYSIFAINPRSKKLNSKEELLIDMHLRINDFSDYEKFQKKLCNIFDKDKIRITQHLGVSDIIVHLLNVTMPDFINSIIMNEDLKCFQVDFISSTNTKFSHNLNMDNVYDIINKYNLKKDICPDKTREFPKVNSIENLKQMLHKDRKKYEYYSEEYYTTIVMILNSLKQIEHNSCTNFLYKAVINSLDLFITYIYENVPCEQIEELMSEERLCEYIKALESIIQCSSRSILKSFDEPVNFDTVHYVPPLLIAFYNLYLKDLTNDFSENHTFLISPTFDTHVKVLPIFDNIAPMESRVLLILIPNKLFFSPKELCPILIHEVGHYFGNDIRDRKLRFHNLFNSLLYFFRIKVLENTNKVLDEKIDESIKENVIDICISSLHKFLLNKYFNEDYLENNDNLYLDILIPKMKEAMVDFYRNKKLDIVNKVMTMFIERDYDYNILKWKRIFIDECDNLTKIKINSFDFTIEDVVLALEDIYKESYSDIFSFSILDIKDEKNIDYIYRNCLNKYYYLKKEPDYISLRKKIIYDVFNDEKSKTDTDNIPENLDQDNKQFDWKSEYDLFNIEHCYDNLLRYLKESRRNLELKEKKNIIIVQEVYSILCNEQKSILDKLETIEKYVIYKNMY